MPDKDTEPDGRRATTRRRLLRRVAAGATVAATGGRAAAVARATDGRSTYDRRTGEREGDRYPAERGQDQPPSVSDLVFFSVGALDCTIASDGVFPYRNPAAVLFATAPREALADALRERGVELDSWQTYVSPYPPLVVEAEDRTVLIDTGAGDLAPTTGQLPDNLHTAGIAPGDVDVVFLTHGHPDHIGGTVDEDGRPAFPDARYVMPRRDWEFWTGNPDLGPLRVGEEFKTLLRQYPQAKLAPLSDRIELIEGETSLAPGVTAIPAPGHTPGHYAVELTAGDERFLHLADVALHPLHVQRPEWLSAIDYAPEQTTATRRDLYARAVETEADVLGYHFPSPGLGHVRERADGWRWDPVKSG